MGEPSWDETLSTFERARSQIARVGVLERRIEAEVQKADGMVARAASVGGGGHAVANSDRMPDTVAALNLLVDGLHGAIESYCVVSRRLVNVATSLADPLEADLLLALYAQGESQRDYAEEHGIDRATVSRRKAMAIEHARFSPRMPALILEVEGVERALANPA